MKVPFQFLVTSFLAGSFALCGYGDWRSELHASPARNKFSPMVTKDAKVALGVNLDKQQVFKAIDLYADRICTIAKLDIPTRAMVKARIAVYKKDLFADVPEDERGLLVESGLGDANFRWAVLSLEGVNYKDDAPQVIGLSLALAGKFDFENFISFIKRKLSEEKDARVALQKVPVKGENAWRVVPKDVDMARQWGDVSIDLHVTSLDGQLILLTSSRETLEKQILLYRLGSGKGDALSGFSAKEGDLLHLTLPGTREFVPQSVVPGDWLGMEGLDFDWKVSPEGKVSESFQVRDGSIVFSILGGALFPVISSAMLSADTSTMAMQGRNLITGIIQANVERESAGLGPVWPRTVVERTGKADDVAARAYTSATDYFRALFDMDHYGSSEWNPYVEGDLLSSLSGCGVPGMSGRTLEKRNVAWIVAANVTDEMPDFVPVLITANFNPALLLRKWDGHTDGSKRLPIGPASGAEAHPFGEKTVVIVRKSGAVESVKARFLTYDTLYFKQAFDLTNMDPPLKYLTPTGVVEPVGHK